MEIEAGRITGLIGPNGAGKTTIFNMIAGVMKPTSGKILFEGRDITGTATHQLFHMGVVRTFQIPHEFGKLTVLENLMVTPPNQDGENLWKSVFTPGSVLRREREVMKQADAALEFLTMSHLRDELAQTLSGGQKKLLELGHSRTH